MRRWIRGSMVILVLLALGVAGALWYVRGENGEPAPLRTAPIRRGELIATISATGTVEPEQVVDVGAQVAGRIDAFGKDKNGRAIDYGSVVEQGTVLAQIDDSVYAAEVAQAAAQLEQAKAAVVRAEADLGQMRAKLVQAKRDWGRARELKVSEIIAQSDYDAAEAAFGVAEAEVAVGEAAIVEASKAQAQTAAALEKARQDLGYCTIKSPVKGVIIDRRVNIGQTVVASLNAPSLFLIAKDLGRMQVWVSVNEADIGSIHPGQPVTFTVDANPGEVFRGEVNKIRLNAAMTQNVVTYTVKVNTDNSSGKLLPYLTANALFAIDRWDNVLMVPNAALRWEPQPQQVAPEARSARNAGSGRDGGQGEGASKRAGAGRLAAGPADGELGEGYGTIWVPAGRNVKPVRVRVGATDGVSTIVQAGDLREGMPVALGEQRAEADESVAGATPFAPQVGRSRGGAAAR